MGPGRLTWPIFPPPRVLLSPQVFWSLLEFIPFTIAPRWTSLSSRFLRGKGLDGESFLKSLFALLSPEVSRSLSFGLHWRVDVHERAWPLVLCLGFCLRLSSCYCVIMGLVETSPKMSNFLPKYNMLQNPGQNRKRSSSGAKWRVST